MPEIAISPITLNDKAYYPRIAKISSTFLGVEDHGILTSFLYLDYTDWGSQGAGGYALDAHNPKTKGRQGWSGAAVLIRRTLEVCNVDKWEDLKGKRVIALRDSDSFSGYIRGLMNIEKGDDYFLFDEVMKDG